MAAYNKYRKMKSPQRDAVEAVPPPVCKEYIRCKGCPYPAIGFICCHSPGSCIRTDIARLHGFDIVNQEVTAMALAFARAQEEVHVTL